jgi:hypothetical protein
MSYLCDFCSRSVGSRCVRNLEGVRVGGSCDGFAPTLQSVFGLRELHDLMPKGLYFIREELEQAAAFYRFPEEEKRRLLALVDEVPPAECVPPAFPKGDPVLVFESPRERGRATAHLEAQGMSGLRGQRGLTLVFADVPTLARAVISLTLEAGIRRFHVSAPPDEDV